MKSITFFPIVEKESQLIDLLSRASWYLTFCPLDRIYIPIRFDHLRNIPWQVADGMDEAIEQNFEKLRSRVNFILAKKESDLRECISKSEIILRWQINADPSGSTFGSKLKRTYFRWKKKYFSGHFSLGSWFKGKKVWEVDPVTIRMEGSFYIQVGLHLIPNKPDLVKENQSKFESLSKKLGKFKRAYLMATGPSISNYKKYDFENSLNIVCNSVILDDDLMQTVKPQILVFADPIFHFGPSQYAGAFRKALIESSKRYDFTICMPFKYYGLFISVIPELTHRTIGIPFMKNREWNFFLDKDFILKTTANILTLIMLPLAGTFARDIGFLGCDGRPLEENEYFWKHNEKTQINDKMHNIQEVHPGFFSIDYNDYYIEHCNTLEAQLKYGEQLGFKFYSLTFSHIPALKTRISQVWPPPDPKPENVIFIDPHGADNQANATKKCGLGAIFRIEPGRFFKTIGPNQWRYMHLDAPKKYWIAYTDNLDQTAGKTFVGMILLQTNKAMRVRVTIGRHGTTDYEGEAKTIKLLPGVTERVELRKKFIKSHTALKLQVEVVELCRRRRKAKLKLEPLYINESLPITYHNVDNTNDFFKDSQYLFVLGNGPSLGDIDFNQLKGHPTIGMNVAFRHWQRIGWYPTYYICLDTVVTESQKANIFSLVKSQDQNGIKCFMLRKNILNFYPQLRWNPSVLIFEDYEQNPVFYDANPITTGSHAVLFGVMMGYKKIYLFGIDCNYVQQIPEAKNVEKIILEMTRTPEKNPNYFFDDYQQKGDRFHVPDSYPNLHYKSWKLVKKRMERFGVDVVNFSPVSQLDMFGYLDIPAEFKRNKYSH